MNAIIDRSSASSKTGGIRTSHGIEALRKDDDNEATRAPGFAVRKDIGQDGRQRVEWVGGKSVLTKR